jgi:hypothetical protein
MYFSVPNPFLLLILPVIFYGLGIVMTSSIVAILLNKVIRLPRKVDVVKLLKSASAGLGISLIAAFTVVVLKALLWKDVNLFFSELLYINLFTLLFLYLPLSAIILSVITSAFKQVSK